MYYYNQLMTITSACVTELNDLLRHHNIPAYAFKQHYEDWDHSWIKYLDLPTIADTYYYKKEYYNFTEKDGEIDFYGHLNLNGNKALGKALRKELDKVL